MAEIVRTPYNILCEVRLLHHYWLDAGDIAFDTLTIGETKDKKLLLYDSRKIFLIEPTLSTQNKLVNYKCIFKNATLGFVVAIPATQKIPDDIVFDFVVTVIDPAFYEYSALTLQSTRISEFADPTFKTVYRYKENVPLLSNRTGAKRGSGVNTILFLSREYPTSLLASDGIESFVNTGGILKQSNSDPASAVFHDIHQDASNAPVFVHQGDSPAIVSPPGLQISIPRGILLTPELPENILALIRIHMKNPNDASYDCTTNQLSKTGTHPRFEVLFKNRYSYRRYMNLSDGSVRLTEAAPLPFTFLGNAGTRQKPSRGNVKKVPISNAQNAPKHLVSEIYI